MGKWFNWPTGEMSKLRRNTPVRVLGNTAEYKLDSADKVDYGLARDLYNNTNQKYKLGAGFAKPVINTTVGFMGVPGFKCTDEDAQALLKSFFEENVSKMQKTHRDAMMLGDCFVWLTREASHLPIVGEEKLVYNIIPPEQVVIINRDPLTRRPIEYILEGQYDWYDENRNKHNYTVTQSITKDRRVIKFTGREKPPGLEDIEEENKWGFIPIVHFRNEVIDTSEYGQSDLEPIEPVMKAYHDVMLQAIQGNALHSTPKLAAIINKIEEFIKNNFGVNNGKELAKKGPVDLQNKDFWLLGNGDELKFVAPTSSIGSAENILKLLFYCLVDFSETPEFAFGVHTPSSQASVKEQMPVLVKKVERKREQFTDSWQELAQMVLAMDAKSSGKAYSSYNVKLTWDEIDPRDEKDVAETILNVVNALSKAVMAELISDEAAVNYLRYYIDTMQPYETDNDEVPGEKIRILKGKLQRARLEDGLYAEKEEELLDKVLSEMDELDRSA
jgi:hypothetical protein